MEENKTVKIAVADPTALGLLGLAMVTFVGASQKLGLTDGTSMIIPWALFLGSVAQIIAGVFDFKHNNLFGATAFCAYGLFWLAVAMSWMIGGGVFGDWFEVTADTKQLGVALLGYLIFSLFMTVAAFRLNTLLSILMIFIDVLLLALTISTLFVSDMWHTIAAYSELVIALMSFYGAGAALLNKSYGRVLLPLGKPWTR